MKIHSNYVAECMGTAGLLMAVVGSGIMAEQLASGNMAIALLANTLATVWALLVLIEILSPMSGAHFNPIVSWFMVFKGKLTVNQGLYYTLYQCLGAILGVWLSHWMFELPILEISQQTRTGMGQWTAEVVATMGLLWVVLYAPIGKTSFLVASYIGAAYWFTSSTSFANPAAVLGRMFTSTFSGIMPIDGLFFIMAQGVGMLLVVKLTSKKDAQK